MLQYVETIFPSVESLRSSLQDEVYFMGFGAVGVTNNSRHRGHHLRFYQELESRLRPREIVIA